MGDVGFCCQGCEGVVEAVAGELPVKLRGGFGAGDVQRDCVEGGYSGSVRPLESP